MLVSYLPRFRVVAWLASEGLEASSLALLDDGQLARLVEEVRDMKIHGLDGYRPAPPDPSVPFKKS